MGRKSRLRAQQRTEKTILPQVAEAQTDRKQLLIACALLVVAIVVVYARVGTQDFINYDDPLYVSENETVQQGLTAGNIVWAFTSFHGSHWHPLTSITHLIDVSLFSVDAGAHKLVNVAFHAGAAILLLLFLVRATGALWPSFVVAALFALHPTRVESVAWVSERKDVLSAFFWMLALFLYAKRTRMVWVAIAFACALMSKASTVTLPFVLLLLDYWPLRRNEPLRKLIIEKIPLFVLLIPAILMTLRAQSGAISSAVSLGGRIANTLISYVSYLRMLFWPADLAVFYPYRMVIQTSGVVLAAVLLIAITIAALSVRKRAPFITVGWLWFIGTLVPMPGVVQAGQQSMADRFTYIPFVGLFIAIVWAAYTFIPLKRELAIVAVAVLVALGAATFVQAGYWQNSETVFARAVAVTERNALANLNLGSALMERGAVKEAGVHFRTAVEIEPNNALAQNGLGVALAAVGDNANAEKALRRAIELDPKLSHAYRKLAEVQIKTGKSSEAIALLEKANREDADDAGTRAELASVKGDVDGAIANYAQAIEKSPNDGELRNSYAAMLARKGRDQDALEQYRVALRLRPDHYEANMNIGALLARLNQNPEAIDHFVRAAATRPGSPEPRIYLALIYGNQNEPQRAVAEVDAARKLDPEGANKFFTNAVRIPYKETNLQDYRAALMAQVRP